MRVLRPRPALHAWALILCGGGFSAGNFSPCVEDVPPPVPVCAGATGRGRGVSVSRCFSMGEFFSHPIGPAVRHRQEQNFFRVGWPVRKPAHSCGCIRACIPVRGRSFQAKIGCKKPAIAGPFGGYFSARWKSFSVCLSYTSRPARSMAGLHFLYAVPKVISYYK